jgi:hypothetical protein
MRAILKCTSPNICLDELCFSDGCQRFVVAAPGETYVYTRQPTPEFLEQAPQPASAAEIRQIVRGEIARAIAEPLTAEAIIKRS